VRPEASRVRVSGVILAAGSSVRMGCPKQLLPLAGRPLLEHVVETALASRLAEVVVVLGARADEVRAGVRLLAGDRIRVVVNEAHEQGVSTSLRCGLAACAAESDAAAILLGDQPGVTRSLLERTLDAFDVRRAPIVRPVFRLADHEPEPGHPVVLARSVWSRIESLNGDEGVRAVIARNPELLETVPIEAAAPCDVDTLEDYARVCAAAARAVAVNGSTRGEARPFEHETARAARRGE